MDRLTKDIQNTIEYGERFGVNYSNKELARRLISKYKYDFGEVTKKIKEQNKHKQVTPLSHFGEKKLRMAEEFVKTTLRWFPDILMVSVTGSVAAGYCRENDDIDLMIVTANHRLWLNRLLLRIWIWMKRIPHRRYGVTENKDDFCFNLWMEEGQLKLPKNKQTLRNAMDSILMVPVLDKKETYIGFLSNNAWIGKYLQNTYTSVAKKTVIKTDRMVDLLNPLTWLNWVVFWPQYWYMKGKIRNELIDLRTAFFHPSDRIRYVHKDSK